MPSWAIARTARSFGAERELPPEILDMGKCLRSGRPSAWFPPPSCSSSPKELSPNSPMGKDT
eukprot:10887373-Alexandrium_andersonii.AAC.1